MATDRTDSDGVAISRVEVGLLIGVGLTFFGYGVAQWVDVLSHRPPAVDFGVGLGLLRWSVSLLRRSQGQSTGQPAGAKRDV